MNNDKIGVILICFFGSLSSFYFSRFFGLRLFEFFAFFMLILTFKDYNFDKSSRSLLTFFVVIILYATASVIIAILNGVKTLYLNQYYGVLFSCTMSFLFFVVYKGKPDLLFLGIKVLILIHSFFFLFQFYSFYILGNYIDFIEPLTGHTQRNIGGSFSFDTAIRASGLYSEPASYALNIIAFNFLFLVGKRKLTLLNVISIVTVLLSMSALGILYLAAFTFLYLIFYETNNVFKLGVLLGIVILSLAAIQMDFINLEYLIKKVVNFQENESYKYRIGNTFTDLMSFSEFEILFGKGLGNLDIKFSKGSTYGMMFIEQGILYGGGFFILLFFLLKKLKVKYYNIGFVYVLFLGTHTFSQFQFWFLILSLGMLSSSVGKKELKC